jgi:hypothetical protein
MKKDRLVKSRVTHIDPLPLEIKPGLTKAEFLTALKWAAWKAGSADAKGDPLPPESQKALEELYNRYLERTQQ